MIVNVPPWTSSGLSLPSRARVASSAIAAASPSTLSRCACRITGTTRPFLERDRDPEVDVVVEDHLIPVDRGVEDREAPQRLDGRQSDERQIGRLDPAPAHRLLQLSATSGHRREVRLDDRRAVRRRREATETMCSAIALRIGESGSRRVRPTRRLRRSPARAPADTESPCAAPAPPFPASPHRSR